MREYCSRLWLNLRVTDTLKIITSLAFISGAAVQLHFTRGTCGNSRNDIWALRHQTADAHPSVGSIS